MPEVNLDVPEPEDEDTRTAEELLSEAGAKFAEEHAPRATPRRVQFNFTAACTEEQLEAIGDALIADAEARGLFFEFAHVSEMEMDDVIEGSPLHEVVTGTPARS